MFSLELSQFVVLAGLVYSLLEFLKPIYDQATHKWNFDRVGALALGIGLCLLAKFDLLAESGIRLSLPYFGEVLSGILVGGAVGAGLVHDFPDFLKKLLGRPTV